MQAFYATVASDFTPLVDHPAIASENTTDLPVYKPQTFPIAYSMDQTLQHYPSDRLDLIRAMLDNYWIVRGLSRMPTGEELQMPYPPFGLLHDEDWEEQYALQRFLA